MEQEKRGDGRSGEDIVSLLGASRMPGWILPDKSTPAPQLEELELLDAILRDAADGGAYIIAEVEQNGRMGKRVPLPNYNGAKPIFTNEADAYASLTVFTESCPDQRPVYVFTIDVHRLVHSYG